MNGEALIPTPLLAPPVALDNHLVVMVGPRMLVLDPPNKEPIGSVRGLFNPNAAPPENVPADERNYYLCRSAPMQYKRGFLLLPLRNRELIEVDLRNPLMPQKRSLLAHLTDPPPEVVGNVYFEEHSKLADESLFVGAFGTGRCAAMWTSTRTRRVSRSAGRRRSILRMPRATIPRRRDCTGGAEWCGRSAPEDCCRRSIPSLKGRRYESDVPGHVARSAFSSVPNDNLVAMVQRNGKVIVFNLETRQEVWSLPPRAAMEESVGVMIDDTGVYVASRKDDYGELAKYPRASDGISNPPKPDVTANSKAAWNWKWPALSTCI